MTKKPAIHAALAIGALVLTTTGAPAPQAQAADFYKGKSLTVIVGYRPGGGVDANARLVSRHIGKFIPGNPEVIVKNMDGAGGGIAANYVYNKAKPDGLTIAVPGRDWLMRGLIGVPGVRFDAMKYTFIGSPGSVNFYVWIRGDTGIKSLDDLKKSKKTIVFGGLRPTTATVSVTRLMQADGWPIKVQPGYRGTAKVLLALEQKEVDAYFVPESSLRRRKDLLDKKFVLPIVQALPGAGGKHLPALTEIVSPKRKATLKFMLSSTIFGVPVVAPPGVPKDRADILRKAFVEMAADKAYQADAAKIGVPTGSAHSGQKLRALVADIIKNTPKSSIADYKRLTAGKKK